MRITTERRKQQYNLCLLLFLIVIALPSAYAQPLTPKTFGLHLRYDGNELPSNWPTLVQQTNSKILRIPIGWGWLEQYGKGNVPTWFWPRLDDTIIKAKNAGQKVLIGFSSTPCWATVPYSGKNCSTSVVGAGQWNYQMPPAKASDYTDGLKLLINHLAANPATKGVVVAYEIWNEPNILTFWANTKRRTFPFEYNDGYAFFTDRASIKAYTDLVIASYKVIKALDPSLKVIAGSVTSYDDYFIDEMYKNGVKGYFDALSIHPYPGIVLAPYHPRYGRAQDANDCLTVDITPNFGCFKQGVETIRAKMLSYGDTRPIWFTEFGISSSPDWGGAGLIKGSLPTAEQVQSTEAFKMIHLIKSWDFVDTVIWYEFINRPKQADYATNQWAQVEPYFGLYREDTSAKSVLATFRTQVNANPVPVQLAPSGDIANQAYTNTFSWQAVPNATGYVLWLNHYTNPPQNGKIDRYVTAAQASCATGYTCKLTDNTVLTTGITNQWWVKAFFADGSTRDSQAVSFKLVAPTQPTLIAPKQNTPLTASSENNAPTFTWKPFPGATSYYFWMRVYSPYGVDQPGQTGDETLVSQTLTPAQANCTASLCSYRPSTISLDYAPGRWAVTANLSNGQSKVSPLQGFTPYPSSSVFMKPGQIEPEGIINTQKPTYVWTPITGATQYRLWVNGGNGSGIINVLVPASACNTKECRYTPSIAVGKGDAAWWITAITTNWQEAVSSGMTFRAP